MASPDLIAARERFRQLGQADLFSGPARQTVGEAMELTVQALQADGPSNRHGAVAGRGSEDSRATQTLRAAQATGSDVPAPAAPRVVLAQHPRDQPQPGRPPPP